MFVSMSLFKKGSLCNVDPWGLLFPTLETPRILNNSQATRWEEGFRPGGRTKIRQKYSRNFLYLDFDYKNPFPKP
jgi:hypothetical protein